MLNCRHMQQAFTECGYNVCMLSPGLNRTLDKSLLKYFCLRPVYFHYYFNIIIITAEGKAIIFYRCNSFFYFVSVVERPAMGCQPNLVSSSEVISIYKCPCPPKNNLGPFPSNLGRKIYTTFYATSALDTAHFQNKTSRRQTKILVSIYNVSLQVDLFLWPLTQKRLRSIWLLWPTLWRPLRCNHQSCTISSLF